MKNLLRQTWATLSFIVLLLVARSFLSLLPLWQEAAGKLIDTALWLSFAVLTMKIVRIIIWEKIVRRVLGRQPPRLMMQLGNVIIFFLAVSGIISFTFDKTLTGFWTASGAVGIVIGFALRNLILDTFSGLAIHVENPFSVGDWITCHTQFGNYVGRVEETNWRTTLLWTTERNMVIIPNSLIASTVLTNFSRPNEIARFDLEFTLDYSVTNDRAMRVLKAAVRNTTDDPGILEDPPPEVVLTGANAYGIVYSVRYFIDPSITAPISARTIVLTSVMEHFRHSGLTLAYPKQDIYHTELTEREKNWTDEHDLVSQLKHLSIFSELNENVLTQISKKMKIQFLDEGTTLVKQGEHGSSMFIVAEGLLDVMINAEDKEEPIRVAYLSPGNFFGEKSLLTGEPRSATIATAVDSVVCEIDKNIMSELLEQDMEVAKILSRAVAKRDQLNQDAMSKSGAVDPTQSDEHGKDLLNRIVKFFGMKS